MKKNEKKILLIGSIYKVCGNRFFGIYGDWKIGFRSTLVHRYRRWCPVKCRCVYAL